MPEHVPLLNQSVCLYSAFENTLDYRATKPDFIRNPFIETENDRYPADLPPDSALPSLHVDAFKKHAEKIRELVSFKSVYNNGDRRVIPFNAESKQCNCLLQSSLCSTHPSKLRIFSFCINCTPVYSCSTVLYFINRRPEVQLHGCGYEITTV